MDVKVPFGDLGRVCCLFIFPPLAPIFTHEYLARPKYRTVGLTYCLRSKTQSGSASPSVSGVGGQVP